MRCRECGGSEFVYADVDNGGGEIVCVGCGLVVGSWVRVPAMYGGLVESWFENCVDRESRKQRRIFWKHPIGRPPRRTASYG
ncbi:MAG: hypothetical protein ACE5Z5_12175 [Candidatus Bathyarchaeia archaeon]